MTHTAAKTTSVVRSTQPAIKNWTKPTKASVDPRLLNPVITHPHVSNVLSQQV